MKQYTKDEIIFGIDLVKTIVLDDMQWTDYLYSGDRDTMMEAFQQVVKEKEGIDEAEFTKELADKWDVEIRTRYSELTEWGKDRMKTIGIVNEYLDKMKERFTK